MFSGETRRGITYNAINVCDLVEASFTISLIANRVSETLRYIMGSAVKILTSTELPNPRTNDSTDAELPIDMRFNEGHVVSIVIYSVLMIVSAIGNATVLVLITRRKRVLKSRIHVMLMHLAIADLLVSIQL